MDGIIKCEEVLEEQASDNIPESRFTPEFQAPQSFTGSAVGHLVRIIREEERKRRATVWGAAGSIILISIILAGIAFSLLKQGADLRTIELIGRAGAVCAMALPLALAGILAYPSRRLRESMNRLADHTEPEALGPLLESYGSLTDLRTTRTVRRALSAALLRVRASDAATIPEFAHQKLLRLLTSIADFPARDGSKRELYIAALKAITQVRDKRAIPMVEKISKWTDLRDSTRRELQESAAACLPILRMRARETAAPNTLLRAARPDSTTDLLTPAICVDDANPDILLRAGNRE